jgi:hypothetical protein
VRENYIKVGFIIYRNFILHKPNIRKESRRKIAYVRDALHIEEIINCYEILTGNPPERHEIMEMWYSTKIVLGGGGARRN